jgi:hypothetical protein
MDIVALMDEVIKLFEHVGPCVALLLILHTQNASSLRQLLARMELLSGQVKDKA